MKVLEIEKLTERVRSLRSEGKKIAHCHGCFDLMHPGHIRYFQAAKRFGDVLVVTVSPDIYVDKGPGRPVFNQDLRVESIAALECVDYVAVNKWPTAEETLRLIRPDFYIKGQEFERLEDKTGKIQREFEVVKEIGAEMRFTHEIVFSSTKLIGKFLMPQDKATKDRQIIKDKIFLPDDLVEKVEELKKAGKTIVQSHGIFDLIHPGVIAHLNSAKGQGDVLIVSVIKDKDVRRGPGRPIFPEDLRVENVASLEMVDYACLADDGIPFDCIGRIRPHIFAKGQAYKERDGKIHEKIFKEGQDLYFGKSRIFETPGFSFSTSSIINNFLDIYPPETKAFLRNFGQRYSFDGIVKEINELQKLRVLLIGDGIIDEYHYCEPLGKSAKTPLIVNKYLTHEVFAGGAFAIANHLAGLCADVHLVSLLGEEDPKKDFIKNNLKPNVEAKFFYRPGGPTIVKKRYVSQQNQKMFEVNYLNDSYINGSLESRIIEYLKSVMHLYDVILISDFGHGFITSKVINTVRESPSKFAINTQTNGANAGYNMITKYRDPAFVCLDEAEVRLAAQDRYRDIETVARGVARAVNSDYFIVTRGRNGSIGINKQGEVNRTPVFSTKVIDTVGAGDAFFAYTAPCIAHGMPLDLVSFVGNAVGALAVQIVGNKKPVEKYELLEFIHTLLK